MPPIRKAEHVPLLYLRISNRSLYVACSGALMNSILYCAVEKPMWHLINSKTFGKHACLVQPCFTAHCSDRITVERRGTRRRAPSKHPATTGRSQCLTNLAHKTGEAGTAPNWAPFASAAPPHACWYSAFYCPFCFPSSDQKDLKGDGRDHYITKHPVAIVLSDCRGGLPPLASTEEWTAYGRRGGAETERSRRKKPQIHNRN